MTRSVRPDRDMAAPAPDTANPPRDDDPAAWRRFVAAWQDPIYSLALRLLRDEADAADATQEIFVTVWRKRDRYDPGREFRPWFYTLAMNVVRGHRRMRKRRRRSEQEVPVPSRHRSDGDQLERTEEARILEEHLHRLPEESRTLIVLHYQQGLSQHEIARTVGLRRSTVQSRLGRAVDHLRASLRRHGHFALIPVVEVVLRRSDCYAAPAAVTESLLQIPTTAAAAAVGMGAAGAGFIVGGITMSKAIAATLVAVAALSLAAGWGIGKSSGPSTEGTDGGEKSHLSLDEQRSLETELEGLRLQREELQGSLAKSERVRAELAAELAGKRELAARGAEVPTDLDEAAAAAVETIDWAALAAKFADNKDFLLRISGLISSDANLRDELTTEERMLMQELQRAWMDAAMIARKQADVPFLDADVLPNIYSTIFGSTLGMDEDQFGAIEASSFALLDAWGAAREGSPLEVYQARQEILSGMDAALRSSLNPDQLAMYDRITPIAGILLQGPTRKYQLGMEGREGLPERVTDSLRSHYGISANQEPAFLEIMGEYDRGAREIMGRNLEEGQSLASISEIERERLQREYLRWQLASEAKILRLLDDRQLEALRGKMPSIFTFEPTGSTSISVEDSPGF